MKLSEVKKEFEKYIVIRDPWAVDLVLATLIGNALIPRDPLWTMLVAPSSGGKSTLLAPAVAVPAVYFLDDLTEKTFLSGYKIKGKESSLLKIIGSGVLCFSDFTSILSKNPMSRGEILGQLRLIYDGVFSKRTGTGEITWRGKMGFLGASTPDIYFQLEASRSMGERFIYYTLEQPSDQEIVRKQESVSMSSREISEVMQPYYKAYCESIREYVLKNELPDLKMTADQQERVHRAAIFCVAAKATVHLDFKTAKPDALVNRPGVGRDRKMFNTLLHTLQLMDCHETGMKDATLNDDRIALVEKCAYSSVGRERRKILEILTKYDTHMTASQIGSTDDFGLQKDGVEKYLYVLNAVGLIQKDAGSNTHKWYIESDETKDFVRSVSGVKKEQLTIADAEISDDDEEARKKSIKDFDDLP